VFGAVLGIVRELRPTGAIGVNEDEFAEFLDLGGHAADRGGASRGDPAGRLRDLLADESVWAEPASDGIDNLLAAIEAESAGPVVGARPSPGPARRAGRRRGVVIALSAAAAVLVVAGVVGILTRGQHDDARQFDVAGTELAPEASAVATVDELGSGVAIELDVRGLPPAPPGTYYQAWVKGDEGLVTVGTFHMRDGDDSVELWSGVPVDRYPKLTVTLQQEGGGQESSGQVVLSGPVGG
jgi:Anti-sigma-K factor rskA, C-terminal